MAKVVVIGGGYAGLACLIELAKKAPQLELALVDGRAEHCKITNLHNREVRYFRDPETLYEVLVRMMGSAIDLEADAMNGTPNSAKPTCKGNHNF